MEPTILIYIGAMSILGLFATNILSKNCFANSEKKEYIRKKTFKHYRSV
jgi:hypothetical protein